MVALLGAQLLTAGAGSMPGAPPAFTHQPTTAENRGPHCARNPKYQANCPKSSALMRRLPNNSSAATSSALAVCTPAISRNRGFYLSSA